MKAISKETVLFARTSAFDTHILLSEERQFGIGDRVRDRDLISRSQVLLGMELSDIVQEVFV